MGSRINTIMQTCFFSISGILPGDEAIKHIKKSIEKSYGKRGPEVVRRNCEVVDQALAHLHEIKVPASATARRTRPPLVSEQAPDFVQKVTAVMLAGKGDLLPVSAFPVDGTLPDGHREMGEAQPRARDPGLGLEDLHPVQPVRARLPARGDSRQGLRRRRSGGCAADVQVDAVQGHRAQGQALHDSGRAGGLHGLQPVRQRLPGQGSHQPEAQGDRHAPAGAAARSGARELRLLPRPSPNSIGRR